jgi:tRNA (adenine57-N1/adenine58-N1)-methyltransferase catalytic subunit
MLRTVAPNGHLHTFDFHEQRADRAREEFISHGFDGLVSVSHRDVCSDGFGLNDATADAVFLDLPSPWLAVPFASKALRPGLFTIHVCNLSCGGEPG